MPTCLELKILVISVAKTLVQFIVALIAGVTLSKEEVDRLAEMTAASRTWLVLDDTYESFLFSGAKHYAANAPNAIHIFSFSKASPSGLCFPSKFGAESNVL